MRSGDKRLFDRDFLDGCSPNGVPR